MSTILPPPPIFKPTFIQMQRSASTVGSRSPALSPTDLPRRNGAAVATAAASASASASGSPSITTLNSNYLTSSFVPNEEYNNRLIRHSPSISPMTYYTDPPASDISSPLLTGQTSPTAPRKRRRSSQISTKEDIERKRRELKTQHSIIEKKRRIKMNREFEALKFLVPACRVNILNGLNENNFENSNMMHKLTILQSTVEYIKYLHLVIRLLKLQMVTPATTRPLFKKWFKRNGNLKFVDFDLDLQNYRNIDDEFNFEKLFLEIWKNDGEVPSKNLDPISKEIASLFGSNDEEEDEEDDEASDIASEIPKREVSSKASMASIAHNLPTAPVVHNRGLSEYSFAATPNRSYSSLSGLQRLDSASSSYNNSSSTTVTTFTRQSSFARGTRSDRETPPSEVDSASFKLPLPAIIDCPTFTSSKDTSTSSSPIVDRPLPNTNLASPMFSGFTKKLVPSSSLIRNMSEKITVKMEKSSSVPSPSDVDVASQLLISMKARERKSSIQSLLN
ncbi:DEKNAAC102840 [Brettanomyces naardenensis]|uniref:DEKNAAC102840 n=1 Tax=Brettanomyces naardenensis TaxID=13370 RepID=A0A448YLN7_BRENA|nr:DEKNAAC102840 [Brettanomyces naardenensis]